jgi:hypothetical protein
VQPDRFGGTCYQAAHWIPVGQTRGRGKLDVTHPYAMPVKDIWLYPLHRSFRRQLSPSITASQRRWPRRVRKDGLGPSKYIHLLAARKDHSQMFGVVCEHFNAAQQPLAHVARTLVRDEHARTLFDVAADYQAARSFAFKPPMEASPCTVRRIIPPGLTTRRISIKPCIVHPLR